MCYMPTFILNLAKLGEAKTQVGLYDPLPLPEWFEVGPLAAYYKLPLNRVLVAFDGTDLPCGILRLQPKGGFGRHNGSVDFVTMCFNEVICHSKGIGCPPGQMDPKAFVLQKFNKTSLERIDSAIEEGVEILKLVVTKGL
uniref:Peptidyl-tRNA hydrolase n=1 Tax=Oryza nivara TaxID=4536 RepID=A0A0E0HJG2_ORYNI